MGWIARATPKPCTHVMSDGQICNTASWGPDRDGQDRCPLHGGFDPPPVEHRGMEDDEQHRYDYEAGWLDIPRANRR